MVEDDLELAQLLQMHVEREGIRMVIAATPLEGITLFQQQTFDLLILDLSLPQMDGLEICRLIRQESDIPIIISSARSDIKDKTMGFMRGADDYLPKPYDPKELVFRIEAILRRTQKLPLKPKAPFIVDEARQEIVKMGTLLQLTPAEYEILAYLIGSERRVVSREELLLNIGTIHYESSLKSIDMLISRIRHKIGDDPRSPAYILPVRGVGYKFVNQ